MTLNMDQLRRKLYGAIQAGADALEIKAEIVEVEDDDGRVSFRVQDEVNKIWIRLKGGSDSQIHEAYNTAVKPRRGLFVFVRKDGFDYYVTRQAPKEATDYLGEAAGSFASPDKIGELTESVVPARNYGAGIVMPVTDPAGPDASLLVTVTPFWYRHYGRWVRWIGGTIDLADYLPAGATFWHWAMVCIWPYDNSIVVVTGDEYANYVLLTDSSLAELSDAIEGLVPCDAVKLQQGMTTIDRAEYFQHGRLNAFEGGLPGFPEDVSSAYYHIPAGRKVVWPAPLVVSGTLTIEGRLVVK